RRERCRSSTPAKRPRSSQGLRLGRLRGSARSQTSAGLVLSEAAQGGSKAAHELRPIHIYSWGAWAQPSTRLHGPGGEPPVRGRVRFNWVHVQSAGALQTHQITPQARNPLVGVLEQSPRSAVNSPGSAEARSVIES